MSDESTTSGGEARSAPRPRLLDQVRDTMRRKYMSRRTEEAYIHWIRRFLYFTGKRLRRPWARRKSRLFSRTLPSIAT